MDKTVDIKIDSCDISYKIYLGKQVLAGAAAIIAERFKGSKILIVTDSNVIKYYASSLESALLQSGISCKTEVIPAGEESKSMVNASILVNIMAEFKMTRTDAVIALGGGVIGDLTGFASSIYLRGIPYIQIPTTLLAQIDSSVGGKTGVNISAGKNLAGSFYHPHMVFADTDCLKTLPDRDFNAGIAEVIKYGCIYDANLFELLESSSINKMNAERMTTVVSSCCRIKGEYVQMDPFDKGRRMELNFGHTVGHAIENALGYGTYLHGEAVGVGMVLAALWGEEKEITRPGTAERIKKILKKYQLPVSLPTGILSSIKNALLLDKKNLNNSLRFIFLREIGEARIVKVSTEELYNWLAEQN